jgi:beta-carotene ketolase (CrtO type)
LEHIPFFKGGQEKEGIKMAKKEDFDVVIIGSGVSGLVCGCYLQKVGLKVAILEAREEAGGGRMAHELMRPGLPSVQSCIWGELDYIMMHQLNLDLDRYGYQEIEMVTEWGNAFSFPDGTCLVGHCLDPSKTAEKVRRFSEKDAKKMLEIAGFLREPYDDKTSRAVRLMELFYAEPWTWENFDILVNLVAPFLPFDDPYEVTDINGFEMLDLMFESDQLKVFTAAVLIGGDIMPIHTGGGGSIGALLGSSGALSVFHPKHGCHSMAHVYIKCFRALGGRLFNSCPVKKITISGGEARGVVLDDHAAFPGKEITAKRVVSNLNPRLTFTELVGEEHVGKRVIQQLKTNWKGEGQLFDIHWLLKERLRFAAEKFDPDLADTMSVFMGAQTLTDMINHQGQKMAGRIPEKPFQMSGRPHKDDLTQRGLAVTSWDVPYSMYGRGGPKTWDDKDFRRELVEREIEIWEAHSPGFREQLLDYWIDTPLNYERLNPNYLKGCEVGGAFVAPQMWYGNRPGAEGFAKGGIVTPIKNLYNCGGAGFSGSTGGNGYRAACQIAEELEIRNQPWWIHRISEYIVKKYFEKTYVPLKPTSILG